MSKQMKILVLVVMFVAASLMIVCIMNYQRLGKELDLCQQELIESQGSWEKIAAEKEELQAELKAKQKELNKAQLDLDEALRDIEEVKSDIEQLKADIDLLKSSSD